MTNVDDVLKEIAAWRDGRLWGKPAIAKFAGVSIDTVARWSTIPGCPISRPGGTYFAVRGELELWLRSKQPVDAAITNDYPRSA